MNLRPLMLLALATTACHPEAVSTEAETERAYLGLDAGMTRALNLGMDGYNAASSANIDPQTTAGELTGTLTVTGQVDQGASDNKGMRLNLALTDFLDDTRDGDTAFAVTYDTETDSPPDLDLSLRGIPDGTVTGTLVGDFWMSGDLEGAVSLTLALDGGLELADDGVSVARTEGTTHITGTATSDYGTWPIDLTR